MENKRKASAASGHEAGPDTPDRAAKRRKLQEVCSSFFSSFFFSHNSMSQILFNIECETLESSDRLLSDAQNACRREER